MKKLKEPFCNQDVFDLMEEIKKQLHSKWIFLHFNVVKAAGKCNCFKGYEKLRKLNIDGNFSDLI